jgi:hypothetical protein
MRRNAFHVDKKIELNRSELSDLRVQAYPGARSLHARQVNSLNICRCVLTDESDWTFSLKFAAGAA